MARKNADNEYESDVGTLYVKYDDAGDEYNVWFEDFYILGSGPTEVEALQGALRFAEVLRKLIDEAIAKCANA